MRNPSLILGLALGVGLPVFGQAQARYNRPINIITTNYDLVDTTYVDRGRLDGVKVGDKFEVKFRDGKLATQVVVTGVFERMASVKIVDSWLLKDGQLANFGQRPMVVALQPKSRRPAPDITVKAKSSAPKAAAPAAPVAAPDMPPAAPGGEPGMPGPDAPMGLPGAADAAPDGLPGADAAPDGLPAMPGAPDGLPGADAAPDGLPAMPEAAPDGLPGADAAPDGLPPMGDAPGELPPMEAAPDGLPLMPDDSAMGVPPPPM